MTVTETLCQVHQISKSFGKLHVLNCLTFEIHTGQNILLTGENGSGKTTLLRILATLLRPSQGELRLFGSDDLEGHRRLRPRIGYLASQSMLHPDLTLLENFQLLSHLYDVPGFDARMALGLETWRLNKVLHQPCRTLSKGELQKANILRSLLHNPDLILWDEPRSGLDAQAQDQLFQTVRTLQEAGKTLVLSSHDRQEMEASLTHHWHLDGGRLQT